MTGGVRPREIAAARPALQRNFLCFGVPRSGTTFFAAMMNAHAEILCGAERFNSDDIAPASFTRDGYLGVDVARLSESFRQLVMTKDFDHLLALGDKLPRAYFQIAEIARRFDDLTIYVPLRNVNDIGHSWNVRAGAAKNPDGMDQGWSSGQVALFAYLEFYVMAKTLLFHDIAHPFCFFSYAALTDPDRQDGMVGTILAHVGCSLSPELRQFLDAQREASRQSRESARTFDSPLFALGEHPFFAESNAAIEAFESGDYEQFKSTFGPLVDQFERRQIPQFVDLIRNSNVLSLPNAHAYAGTMDSLYRGVAQRTPLPALEAYLGLWQSLET